MLSLQSLANINVAVIAKEEENEQDYLLCAGNMPSEALDSLQNLFFLFSRQHLETDKSYVGISGLFLLERKLEEQGSLGLT